MARAPHDPFGEELPLAHRRVFSVLAADIEFLSDNLRLIQLAEQAFARLPRHRWRDARCRLRIRLRLAPSGTRGASRHTKRRAPPRPRLSSGPDQLIASIDADNFAVICPAQRSAVVQVSSAMLANEYHVRYELIEFAALTLATRAQGLVPLHAACVGLRGRGLLVLGDSGAGKSTFTLCSLLAGLELLSEDSVFVATRESRATGVPNYLHVQADALRFVAPDSMRRRIRGSPVIRRRSGARKYQVDLREVRAHLAPRPLDLIGTLVLSTRAAPNGEMLVPLATRELVSLLRRSQPYAVRQPHWREFERSIVLRGGHRLWRSGDPAEGVQAARRLLESALSQGTR